MAKQQKLEIAVELTPEIITNAKGGNSKAINQLSAWTTNFVRSKIHVSPAKTHDRRSDVSQDVAMKVLDKLTSFEGTNPVHFENWVFVIARRTTAQSIRDASRDKRDINNQVPIEDHFLDGTSAEQKSPSREVAENEAVLEALGILMDGAKVDADLRKVIVFRLLYKFPVAEVAKRLDTTEAAVDSRFRRGIEKLRRLYAEKVGETPGKTTNAARDKRARAFLEYVHRCDAGKTVDIDAFLVEVGLTADDELCALLEMIENIRGFNLKDDEDP